MCVWTYLQVVGEFRAARIARIHRHKDTNCVHQRNLRIRKQESLVTPDDCRENALNLLRNHRQHFDLNAVELIQATPGASLRQTGEHAAQGLVVKAIGAVEHQHKLAHRLA
jgi:hypothetical protein